MTPSLESILEVLRDKRPRARDLGVELIGVVGSAARGEARIDSDVDVVFNKIGRPTLFDLGALMAELEEGLGRRIDLIDLNFVDDHRRVGMERDLVRA